MLGAGLLVGTSLTVIIPEGVNTLFSMETSTKGIFCLFKFFLHIVIVKLFYSSYEYLGMTCLIRWMTLFHSIDVLL